MLQKFEHYFLLCWYYAWSFQWPNSKDETIVSWKYNIQLDKILLSVEYTASYMVIIETVLLFTHSTIYNLAYSIVYLISFHMSTQPVQLHNLYIIVVMQTHKQLNLWYTASCVSCKKYRRITNQYSDNYLLYHNTWVGQ